MRMMRWVVVAAVVASVVITVGPSPGAPNARTAVAAPATADSGYTAIQPARLLDTRYRGVTVDGKWNNMGPILSGRTLTLPVTGRGGVPAFEVSAVVLNVTVTEPTANGFVTVYPTDAPRPTASNLNFVSGQTTPNLTIAKVSDRGQIELYNSNGSTNLIVDVVGWFSFDAPFTPLQPARLLDTRAGAVTVDAQDAGVGALQAGGTFDVTVVGRGGVPATGVGAVVVNLTATGPTASGYVTAYPTGTPRPTASNLNFVAGQTTPNLAVAKVGANGRVTLFNSNGSTDLIVDVVGWFPTTSPFTSLQPARLLDTRSGAETIDGQFAGHGALPGVGTIDLAVTGRGGVPETGVAAVVLNVTATGPTTFGFVTVYPTGSERPTASNLNFAPGQTTPNLTIAKVGAGGRVTLFNSSGSTHLIADVVGWFPVAPPANPADFQAVDVAVGATHSCALMASGIVRCWGANVHGQSGTFDSPNYVATTPKKVTGLTGATAIELGGNHSCALFADHTVKCWGRNFEGQLGNGTTSELPVIVPVTVSGLDNAVELDLGGNHTCALLTDGTVKCWGQIAYGFLGQTFGLNSTVPVAVADVSGLTAIATGTAHTCGVRTNGTVRCWGSDYYGQLGDFADYLEWVAPLDAVGVTQAKTIMTGFSHTCAVLIDGRMQCWGYNYSGQLGYETFNISATSATPTILTNIDDVTDAVGGLVHSCALLENGTVKCWGGNARSELGAGPSTQSTTEPITVAGVQNAVELAGDGQHNCVLMADSTIKCWGRGSEGQLGNGTQTDSFTPVAIGSF